MAVSLAQSCVASTFNPSVFGTEILSLEANLVTNYSVSVPSAYRQTSPSVEVKNASFCNVTIAYTHPGQNDNIITEAWLPLDWNERFLGVGGGGWVAGRFLLSYAGMNGGLADGYASITTDAGLGSADVPTPWALNSPGNVNLYNLQNIASVCLNDEAVIGKSLIRSFYGKDPKYSYWNGCSQGGRQGLMLAQRYPKQYDGIVAGAPAIYWNELISNAQWPQQVMNELGEYPYGCELDAITAEAVSACDNLDGVTDGTIGNVEECFKTFNPFSVVGKSIACSQTNGTQKTISKTAAIVVNETWHGRSNANGQQFYHGITPGSDLTGDSSYGVGIVTTKCNETGCVGLPNQLGVPWLQLFIAKDPNFNVGNLTRAEFDALVYSGAQQYNSLVESADPDLTKFRDAGGKMVTFHGLADNIIPVGATEEYYNAVADITPDIQDFYRYFEAPALGHCFGGKSDTPTSLFEQLRDWVENGTAPEQTPIKLNVAANETHNRILCAYPQKAEFVASCGDPSLAECWSCSKSGVVGENITKPKHFEL
ncbi:hypothetical protein CkaCkLH20_09567 [Colletotrichum karsti]|uniref:Carboxylic ester hydrolase n=1 Tax=Colletotrichum karsti TaxID=1095194 RepID=A0A9P6HXJ2_9PEZI|nr:uncharacterized protein CkaCkLH20_09567 [Colletotrichum karsti]KAF9873057.1 hypothetical protein CkaCkLH20_09567 [Colletotrichum karsti]